MKTLSESLDQWGLPVTEAKVVVNPAQVKWAKTGAEGIAFYEIPIADFLKLTTETDKQMDEIVRSAKSVEFFNRPEVQAGITVHPYLTIDSDGRVVEHEGRHRAAAELNSGEKSFRIAIVAYEKGWPVEEFGWRWKRRLEVPQTLLGQFRQTQVTVNKGLLEPIEPMFSEESVDKRGLPVTESTSDRGRLVESIGGLYHLSPFRFSSFRQSASKGSKGVDLGFHFGTKDQAMVRARQLEQDGKVKADSHLYLYQVSLSVDKPLHLPENRLGANTANDLLMAIFQKAESEGVAGITDEMLDDWYEDKLMLDGENWKEDLQYESPDVSLEKFDRFLGSIGYDSISYENRFEGTGTSYVVFDPSKVSIEGVEEIALQESVDQWGLPITSKPEQPLEEAVKSPKVPARINAYIRGTESAPETSEPEIQAYKKAIYPLLKKKFPSGFITVYRAFTWGSEIDWDGNVNPEELALSYSDSKSFALALAKERRQDSPDEWVYVIQVKLPIDRIYFHHSLDPIGVEHPKEREVIAMAAGAETKIIKEYKPLEESVDPWGFPIIND